MGERDWLSELSEALGEEATGPPHKDHDDELDLSGSGRSLEGWADQLAEAMDEDHDLDGTPRSEDGSEQPGPEPEPGEKPVVEAAPPAVEVRPLAPAFAPWPASTLQSAAGEPSTAERLARIETLLGADLNALGPAVLSESVTAIEHRVESALGRLAALDAPLAALEERLAAHARTLSEPVRVHAVVPAALSELITQLQDQVAELASRPPPAVRGINIDPMIQAFGEQRRDLAALTAAVARLGALGEAVGDLQGQISDLAARSLVAPPPAVDLEPLVQAFGEQRGDVTALAAAVGGVAELHTSVAHLQAQLAELLARPVAEPAPAVDLDPLVSTLDELRAQVAELAERPAPASPVPEAPAADLDVVATALERQHREMLGLADLIGEVQSQVSGLASRSGGLPPGSPGPDLGSVLAAVDAQRGEVAALASAVSGIDELRKVVSQLYSAMVDAAAKPPPPIDPDLVEALQQIYDAVQIREG